MDNVNPVPTKLKEGDLVLIKDHTAKAFQPCYVGNYRIVFFKGNQVEVCKTEVKHTWVHLMDVKYIFLVDNIITKLPDYQSLCRKTKLRLNLIEYLIYIGICPLHWIRCQLNDTTIAYANKYGLCLIMHNKSSKTKK